jgi:ATP synthase protein I
VAIKTNDDYSKTASFKSFIDTALVFAVSERRFFWFDIVVGYSILLGGLTQWVPQFWFTYQAFKYAGASQAQKVLSSMYRGEAGKIVLTASGCIGTFVLFENVNIIGFMGAFISMIPLQLALVVRTLK